MKKLNFLFLFATVAIATMMTSCSKGDDGTSALDTQAVTSAQVTYTYYTTQDMIDLCDITIKYLDESGNAHSVTVDKSNVVDAKYNLDYIGLVTLNCKAYTVVIPSITSDTKKIGIIATVKPKATADLTSGKMNYLSTVTMAFKPSPTSISISTNVFSGQINKSDLTDALSLYKSYNSKGYTVSFDSKEYSLTDWTPNF